MCSMSVLRRGDAGSRVTRKDEGAVEVRPWPGLLRIYHQSSRRAAQGLVWMVPPLPLQMHQGDGDHAGLRHLLHIKMGLCLTARVGRRVTSFWRKVHTQTKAGPGAGVLANFYTERGGHCRRGPARAHQNLRPYLGVLKRRGAFTSISRGRESFLF